MKIVIVLMLLMNFLKAQINESNLRDFSILTSSIIEKNILIDESLPNFNFTYYQTEDFDYFNFLKLILEINNLELKIKNNIYYVSKKTLDDVTSDSIAEDSKYFYVDLKYLNYTDLSTVLDLFQVKHKFINFSNSIMLYCTDNEFLKINELISKIDKPLLNVRIKLSIFEINLGKIKDFQGVINANFTDNSRLALDVILGGISFKKTPTNGVTSQNYESVLKFLYNNNISKVLTNTILTLTNNKTTILNSSQNIPYLKSSNTITDTRQNQINSIDYKDVGLEVTIKPIISDKNIEFDLSFVYSQLLSSTDNKPITTKKSLNQFVSLDFINPYYVIAGINNYSNVTSDTKIPFLGDVPLIGNLFKNEKIDYTTTTTTIFIEIVRDDLSLKDGLLFEKHTKTHINDTINNGL